MSALLCIDLLGTQSRWRQGGLEPVLAAFDDFADLTFDTTGSIDVAAKILGEVDGDWCALECPTPESAMALGRRIFRRAWLEPRSPHDPRMWLRGAVLPADPGGVRRREPDQELPSIHRTWTSPSAVAATMALRTGFDGMRLLVADELLNDQLRGMFRIPLGRLGVIPFRRMNHTPYPPTLGRSYQDFLWMAETMQEWAHYSMRMKQRLLWSAQDRDEFAHAAATQVVFHECDAILQSVTRKNIQRREEEHKPAGDHAAERGADA
jgi:hypothetical protein